MKKTDYLDTILDQQTSEKLLKALQLGVIDMADFAGIYSQSVKELTPLTYAEAGVTQEEVNHFHQVYEKIQHDTSGQLVLGRDLKIRLLNAIRKGRINLQADFPELVNAYQAVQYDWSAITPEEQKSMLATCRKVNR